MLSLSASLHLGLSLLAAIAINPSIITDAQALLRAEAKHKARSSFVGREDSRLLSDMDSHNHNQDAQGENLEALLGALDSTFNSIVSPTPTTTPPFLTNPPLTNPPLTNPPLFTPTPITTVGPVTSAPQTTVSPSPLLSTGGDHPTAAPDRADTPTLAPTTTTTTGAPTQVQVAAGCGGISGWTEEERINGILAILDTVVANPDLIRDNSSPQGLATSWLIQETGQFRVCPGDDHDNSSCGLVQRWALAVIYFSTNGDSWFQCSHNPTTAATDSCGSEDPFVGDARFLSDTSECNWAGISCIQEGCVSAIEFELNNLVGTIPTEIGLLKELRVWEMGRGGLTGTIPTEIGKLTKLIVIDLDFNAITGSLTTELLSLVSLQQLDINDNQFTGSVSGVGVFPELDFLQIHRNNFTGTIPESLGESSKLAVFTLHETEIGGTMPESVCNLLESRGTGGVLTSLIADCSPPNPDIICTCCTDCRNT